MNNNKKNYIYIYAFAWRKLTDNVHWKIIFKDTRASERGLKLWIEKQQQ